MVQFPFAGELRLPTTRTIGAVTADLERFLRESGADSTRRGDTALSFTLLPVRQMFSSLVVFDGEYVVSQTGDAIKVRFRGKTPLVPVLAPLTLVMLIVGMMLVQSGVAALNVATLGAVVLLVVSFVVPAVGKLAMTRLARRALSP